MKKSLVLAMAMALGVTASAYAANPFSDVPAGHWAYGSIEKLAAAGVVDGYPDGSFKGDNLMTRYEMAQIVAKAMAKGANVDALAAEFAEELDNLGVRVAALEKKADNVQITGAIRYRYVTDHGNKKGHTNDIRSRLYLAGQVNDDWSYHAMIQNVHDFGDYADQQKDINFKEAYMTGKLGGLAVTAGRYNSFLGDGNIWDARVDGAELSYGSKIKVTGFVGKANEGLEEKDVNAGDAAKYAAAEVSADLGKSVKVYAGLVNFNVDPQGKVGPKDDLDIWHVGAKFNFGAVGLGATYLHGKYQDNGAGDKETGTGIVINASYKGADYAQPGSWGLFANYYNQDAVTYVAHTTDAQTTFGPDNDENQGFKGYGVGMNYTFAKNIMGTVVYYDTKSKEDSADKNHKLWTELQFRF